MSLDHEKVFKLAKKDEDFQADLLLSNQKFPTSFLTGTLEKGAWAAGYAGWILGKLGSREYHRRKELWQLL